MGVIGDFQRTAKMSSIIEQSEQNEELSRVYLASELNWKRIDHRALNVTFITEQSKNIQANNMRDHSVTVSA